MLTRNGYHKTTETDLFIANNGNQYVLSKPPERWVMSEEGTGMPPISYVTQRGPYQHGESLRDFFLTPRTIQMIVRHNYCDRAAYWKGRNELLSVLMPNIPSSPQTVPPTLGVATGVLRKVMPNGVVRDLACIIQQGPNFAARDPKQWDEWSYTETLRFIAHNPIFFDPTLYVYPGPALPLGDSVLPIPPGFGIPQSFPTGVPVSIQSLQTLANRLINVNGNVFVITNNMVAILNATVPTPSAFFITQMNLLLSLYTQVTAQIQSLLSFVAQIVAVGKPLLTKDQVAQAYTLVSTINTIVNNEINAATDFGEFAIDPALVTQLNDLLSNYSRQNVQLQAALFPAPALAIKFPLAFPTTFYPKVVGPSDFLFPLTFPTVFINSNNQLTVNYAGNWPEYPTITVNGPMNGFTITNTTTGQIIRSSHVVPPNDYVTVTLTYGNKSVTTSFGTNIIGSISADSNLAQFQLVPGPNVISMTDSVGYPVMPLSKIQFAYYNRYIGI